MSKRNKLVKFSENLSFPNVFENFSYKEVQLYQQVNQKIDFKGTWNQNYFKRDSPLVLELACGGGEYCIGMANLFPDRNYIGIDIKGARIWRGAKTAIQNNLSNVAFVRTKIELIPHFFENAEVDEIWITFPDPFLKNSKSIKRLTSDLFLDTYQNILKPNAILHLKTDDSTLYEFTLEVLNHRNDYKILEFYNDIYNLPEIPAILQLKTHYELKHLEDGRLIKYIKFQKSN